MSNRIMIADDDINICNILKSQLESDGYQVAYYSNGKDLLNDFKNAKCDLVITDIMMPDMNGYDVCKEIRKNSDIPIIMISAKDEEIDRVLGLELGSDDYISKPFSLREVSIKVRNMLKRYHVEPVNSNAFLFCKDLKLNLEERSAFLSDQEFSVTKKEYDLLEFF
ncbi:response regulator transcription factor [Haloimpatiens sp. FM7315]|uniref:response regulator transcription factor n=1 Tax=Haloimpatiens sp. FM7315 TaxID=3298609 RepID=UPI00370AB0EF